jgi:hypothetical protein
MPRTCTVCTHPDKAEIDAALLTGNSFRKISQRFGTSSTALFRHRNNHIPIALEKAREAEEVAYGEDLLCQMKELNTRTIRILDAAEAAGDPRIALAAIREVRGNTELLCRIVAAMEARRPSFPCDEDAVNRMSRLLYGGRNQGFYDEAMRRPAYAESAGEVPSESSSRALREAPPIEKPAESVAQLVAKPGESHEAWVQRMVRISQEEALRHIGPR